VPSVAANSWVVREIQFNSRGPYSLLKSHASLKTLSVNSSELLYTDD